MLRSQMQKYATASIETGDAMARKTDKITDTEIEDQEPVEAETVEPVEEVDANYGLVKMRKGDESLHVHPTTVKSHSEAGWKIA
jgi:hypothetical protein